MTAPFEFVKNLRLHGRAMLSTPRTSINDHVFAVRAQMMVDAASRIESQEEEIRRLREALKPFADAVYNDNGDVTISHADPYAYMRARSALNQKE